jgi:hypothetical protein
MPAPTLLRCLRGGLLLDLRRPGDLWVDINVAVAEVAVADAGPDGGLGVGLRPLRLARGGHHQRTVGQTQADVRRDALAERA